jgi:hypothetical protein
MTAVVLASVADENTAVSKLVSPTAHCSRLVLSIDVDVNIKYAIVRCEFSKPTIPRQSLDMDSVDVTVFCLHVLVTDMSTLLLDVRDVPRAAVVVLMKRRAVDLNGHRQAKVLDNGHPASIPETLLRALSLVATAE